jgi:ribosome-binding ATPase YchF (GTP1/OBG family)
LHYNIAISDIVNGFFWSSKTLPQFHPGKKAWVSPGGASPPKAAGKTHSDVERGSIRAEVISYGDLESCDHTAEAPKRGLLRTEGKSYTIQDVDVVTFLFNV